MYVHDILGVSQGQLLEYLTSLWVQINLAQCIIGYGFKNPTNLGFQKATILGPRAGKKTFKLF